VSVLARFFAPRNDPRESLRPLWHAVVARSRDPAWYRDGGVADTVAGRFDMITAILALVLLRLERDPETAGEQALLTELFVEDMDGQLRESGIGDLVVGKHVGRLVSALGGRLGAFRAAPDNDTAWREALARNVSLRDKQTPDALARLLWAFRESLAATETKALLDGALPR
jgi:cytochrome b pre-mRNA-processing protein 3